ncbi:hypothetical protein D3C86_1536480 [compost metagenome]
MDSLTPRSLSACMITSAPSASSSRTLSVSSSSSLDGGRPVASRTLWTRATRCPRWNSTDERFTETIRSSLQLMASVQAACNTQELRGTIKPVVSAMGIKVSGLSSPRCGCCQRTSASAATMRLLLTL